MTTKDNIFDLYAQAYESHKQHSMSLREFLDGCRADPVMYASTAERMITAIGELELVDSAKDARLGRIFEPHAQGLSGLQRLLRPGGDHRAHRRLLPACGAGPGEKKQISTCWARWVAASPRWPTA
jgi:hypothetical protein